LYLGNNSLANIEKKNGEKERRREHTSRRILENTELLRGGEGTIKGKDKQGRQIFIFWLGVVGIVIISHAVMKIK
jgi:hypothetical protein